MQPGVHGWDIHAVSAPGRRAPPVTPGRVARWRITTAAPPGPAGPGSGAAERHQRGIHGPRTAPTPPAPLSYQQVIRVRIVLDAARGHSSSAISRRLDVSVDTVRCYGADH